MKVLIFLAIFCTQLAFAKSRVGEWAAYDYTEISKSKSVNGTLIREIVDEKFMPNGKGRSEKHYKLHSQMFKDSTGTVFEDQWVADSQLGNVLSTNIQLLKCKFIRNLGTIQKINVKAGKFTACKLNELDVWVGAVPFNHILYIYHDDTVFRRYELIKYSWKKKK